MLFKRVFLQLKSIWRNNEDLKKKTSISIKDLREMRVQKISRNSPVIMQVTVSLPTKRLFWLHDNGQLFMKKFFVFVRTNIAMSVYIYIMCKRDDDGKGFQHCSLRKMIFVNEPTNSKYLYFSQQPVTRRFQVNCHQWCPFSQT